MTIGDYILKRIRDLNIKHIFGVPGDFVLGFNKKIDDSDITFVNTCDEQGAGYAADAYARLHGFGVVCITYCVGGLKVTNTTAEAFSEKSPVLVISGSPGLSEQVNNPMLHHKVNTFDTQKKIFDNLTVSSESLSTPKTAIAQIDKVFNDILKYKQPGYIELPRDMLNIKIPKNHVPAKKEKEISHKDVLEEALSEIKGLYNKAKQPVILAGVEIHRHGLQDQLLQLAKKHNIPVATTILGKSLLSETQSIYAGVYMGNLGSPKLQKYVENSDCLLILGAFMTDMNLGIFSGEFNKKKTIHANFDRLSIGYHHYEQLYLKDILTGLTSSPLKKKKKPKIPNDIKKEGKLSLKKNKAITVKRVFDILNSHIDKNMIIVSDVGDSLFGALDLHTQSRAEFLSPAYYASIGFAVPASIGVQCSNSKTRPLVIVGDGAFQMTGQEISTIVRYKLNPIIILLNNKGYGTERPMLDGKFNDVLNWNYSKLPLIYGEGNGTLANTEEEFNTALKKAKADKSTYHLIEVNLNKFDISPALKRLTSSLGDELQ